MTSGQFAVAGTGNSQTGRLFFEFGITLAVSVLVSAFVALTLTPMLCARWLTGPIAQTAHAAGRNHGNRHRPRHRCRQA